MIKERIRMEENSDIEPQVSEGEGALPSPTESSGELGHKRFVNLRKPLDAACEISRYGIDPEKIDLTQIKHKNISDDLQAVKVDTDKFEFGGVSKSEQADLDHCILPLAKLRFLSETQKGNYAPKEQKTLSRQIAQLEDEAKDIQFRNSRRKFLKGSLATATILGSAVACGRTVITPPTPEVTKPTVTEVSPTPDVTNTPEATATATEAPHPEYKAGLPKTLAECNQLRGIDYIEEDLKILLEEEKKIDIIDGSNMHDTVPLGQYLKVPGMPYATRPVAFWDNMTITSCSYLPLDENKGMYVFGIPVRRINTDKLFYLHFTIDDASLEKFLQSKNAGNLYKERFSSETLLSLFNSDINYADGISVGPFVKFSPDEKAIASWWGTQQLFLLNEAHGFSDIWTRYSAYGEPVPDDNQMKTLETMAIPVFSIQVDLSK